MLQCSKDSDHIVCVYSGKVANRRIYSSRSIHRQQRSTSQVVGKHIIDTNLPENSRGIEYEVQTVNYAIQVPVAVMQLLSIPYVAVVVVSNQITSSLTFQQKNSLVTFVRTVETQNIYICHLKNVVSCIQQRQQCSVDIFNT